MIELSPSAMAWAPAMHSSGLFAVLLNFALKSKGSAMAVCDHFYVFSRMALQDPNVFVQLVVESVPQLEEDFRSETVEDAVEKLMDLWWRNFDSMSEARHRKLTAMTMASLATTGRTEIIKRLPTEISNIWLDVLGEIKEAFSEDPNNPSHLNTYWTDNGGEPSPYWMRQTEDTPEGDRRRQLWKTDPVQSVKLTTFINEKLKATAATLGQDVFEREFVKATDPAVLDQLMAYLHT